MSDIHEWEGEPVFTTKMRSTESHQVLNTEVTEYTGRLQPNESSFIINRHYPSSRRHVGLTLSSMSSDSWIHPGCQTASVLVHRPRVWHSRSKTLTKSVRLILRRLATSSPTGSVLSTQPCVLHHKHQVTTIIQWVKQHEVIGGHQPAGQDTRSSLHNLRIEQQTNQ